MYTLDKAIKENKEKLKKIIKDYEEELNKRNFGIIYDGIDGIFLISAFTALLLKNNINPLEYMSYVPSNFLLEIDDIEDFVIPNGIKKIKWFAITWCDFKSITIPKSVEIIEDSAFSNCEITDVYYKGPWDGWDDIKIEYDNEELLNAELHMAPPIFNKRIIKWT